MIVANRIVVGTQPPGSDARGSALSNHTANVARQTGC